ncbi:MAG: hypothetical protein GY842_06130 [bacterium]|nr:hypothetical protein [bacterium]
MTLSLSSTSSSSGVLEDWRVASVTPDSLPSTRCSVWSWACRLGGRAPHGVLAAVVMVVLTHLVVVMWLAPHPVARTSLRQKVIALTEDSAPVLLMAGDSRAEWNLDPRIVAAALRIDPMASVNIGCRACEHSTVLAAYREFADRFADAPIMVLSVSLFSVNDRANQPLYLPDEALWSMGTLERLRLTSLKRVIKSAFLPERALYRQLVEHVQDKNPPPVKRRGYAHVREGRQVDSSPAEVRRVLSLIEPEWFNDPVIDGTRWQLLEIDLQALCDAGVQVVILDAPEHPAFVQAISGTPPGEANVRFHRKLTRLGERMGIPVLSYGTAWYGEQNPDTMFCDLLHLNANGAALFSERVGRDLEILIEGGALCLNAPVTVDATPALCDASTAPHQSPDPERQLQTPSGASLVQ